MQRQIHATEMLARITKCETCHTSFQIERPAEASTEKVRGGCKAWKNHKQTAGGGFTRGMKTALGTGKDWPVSVSDRATGESTAGDGLEGRKHAR